MGTHGLITPKVVGFNKKQVSDALIPSGTCVIFDNKLYKQIVNYFYGDTENPELNELMYGVKLYFMRNPALWASMFVELRVWNRDEFAHHLATEHGILLSNYLDEELNKDVVFIDPISIVQLAHSDVDGDLAPLYCFKHSVDKPFYTPMDICEKEKKWNEEYFKGEFDSDSVMNREMKYKLHFIPYSDPKGFNYSTVLNNARMAKANIGPATNDGWVFAMIAELYMKAYVDCKGVYKTPKFTMNMLKVSKEDFKLLTFVYIQGLQDFVITGVKHNDNGASDFDLLFLRNFSKPKNQKALTKLLSNNLQLDHSNIAKMFSIVNWAEASGVLSACKSFLRLYNKGKMPMDDNSLENFEIHADFIQQNTFFGELMEPMYSILRDKNKQNNVKAEISNALLENLEADFEALF